MIKHDRLIVYHCLYEPWMTARIASFSAIQINWIKQFCFFKEKKIKQWKKRDSKLYWGNEFQCVHSSGRFCFFFWFDALWWYFQIWIILTISLEKNRKEMIECKNPYLAPRNALWILAPNTRHLHIVRQRWLTLEITPSQS